MGVKRRLFGKVGKPYGLRGEFFVSECRLPDIGVPAAASVRVGQDLECRVVRHRFYKSRSVLKIASFDDRTAMERYIGQPLWLDEAVFDHEWSHLVGAEVLDSLGQTVGVVAQFYEFGAGDSLEIVSSDRGEAVLVPVADPYLPSINRVEAGPLTLRVPMSTFAGLWYPYSTS